MKKLGDLLVEEKVITAEQLQQALDLQRQEPQKRLGALLIDRGWVTQNELIHLLSKQLRLPFVDLNNYEVDPACLSLVPEEMIRKYHAIPLRRQNEKLLVAMLDPLDVIAQDEISTACGLPVQPMLARKDDIELFLRNVLAATTGEGPARFPFAGETTEAYDGPAKEIVHYLILQAYRFRATEVNLEPRKQEVRVRYRVDGVPYDFPPLPKEREQEVTREVFSLLGLEDAKEAAVGDGALPRSGRFFGLIGGHRVNLRGFTMPTLFGTRIAVRILNLHAARLSMEEIGLTEEFTALHRFLNSTAGLMLIAGPADSGRSGTYYALLRRFRNSPKIVFSFEDPVEHVVEGVQQIQLDLRGSFDLPSAFSATLAQLPDVVFISRVADEVTAHFAVGLALSGRLVIATLHTFDSASAFHQMMALGIPVHLLCSTLQLVLAQRLVRILCPDCRRQEKGFFRATGCSKCLFTGYRGRTALFEQVALNEGLRDALYRQASAPALRQLLRNSGVTTLAEAARQKVEEGVTSPAEIERVLGEAVSTRKEEG